MPVEAYAAAVLADSPRVFWKAQDASGNPVDSSGNALTATTHGGTYQAAGPIGGDYGIEFPGAQYADRAVVSTITNDFTLEAWCMFVTGASERVLWNGSLGVDGWGMYLDGSHKIFALAGGVGSLASGTTSIGTNTWAHIVTVRDSTNGNAWTYYLNGLVDLANAGTTAPNTPTASSGFGCPDNAGQHRIAYAAIYERALSASRIAAHYSAAIEPGRHRAGLFPYSEHSWS